MGKAKPYRRLRKHRRRARLWIRQVRLRHPALFAHWPCFIEHRPHSRSRMSGDAHVRICESLGVQFPRATRLFITINSQRQYLWRAVDQDGDLIDLLVQPRRDARAARRFFRRLLKSQRQEPSRLVTDKLGSYQVAHRDVMPCGAKNRPRIIRTPRVSYSRGSQPLETPQAAFLHTTRSPRQIRQS